MFKIIAAYTPEISEEDIPLFPSVMTLNRDSLCYFSEKIPDDLKPKFLEAARYIGTVRSSLGVGTGCLLDDGTVLTALHVICDIQHLFNTGQVEGNLSHPDRIWVDFVGKDGQLTSFKVKSIQNHGLDILNRNISLPSSFDFAILELEVNPKDCIGEGLPLDQTNYFGSAYHSDPTQTFAVSRGYPVQRDGNSVNEHYADCSENMFVDPACFQLIQLATHSTEHGDSGMAILSFDLHSQAFKVYGLNLGIEKSSGLQQGIKAQDILLHCRYPKLEAPTIKLRPFDMYSMFIEPHGFRTKGDNFEAKEALRYLGELRIAFRGNDFSKVVIPKFITDVKALTTYSTHQMTHLGTDKSKTRFFILTNDTDPHFRAIAIIVQKALSQLIKTGDQGKFHPAIRRESMALLQSKPTKDMAFYVDLGFDVGNCRKCRADTSWVFVEDAVGGTYHLYPTGIPNRGDSRPKHNDVWVDLIRFLTIIS